MCHMVKYISFKVLNNMLTLTVNYEVFKHSKYCDLF